MQPNFYSINALIHKEGFTSQISITISSLYVI